MTIDRNLAFVVSLVHRHPRIHWIEEERIKPGLFLDGCPVSERYMPGFAGTDVFQCEASRVITGLCAEIVAAPGNELAFYSQALMHLDASFARVNTRQTEDDNLLYRISGLRGDSPHLEVHWKPTIQSDLRIVLAQLENDQGQWNFLVDDRLAYGEALDNWAIPIAGLCVRNVSDVEQATGGRFPRD